MREKLILFLKGIIIGAGKIIPGVSGGMLAMTLGVYDKSVKAISDFLTDFKKSFMYLLFLGIGIMVSVVIISKFIKFSLDNYYLPTMLLFIGLIFGGIPKILEEAKKETSVKNVIIMVIPFIIMAMLSIFGDRSVNDSQVSTNFVMMVIIGLIDAVTMIIPGISGTAILMILGYYDIVISTFSSLTDLSLLWMNMSIMIPFMIGLVLGIFLLAKIINYLLENHRGSAYAAIVGFAISSILLLLKETFVYNYDLFQIVIGLILMVIGYVIGKRLDSFE